MMKMNKKGSVLDVIIWVVIAFVVLMFFAVWLFMFDILNTTFANIETQPGQPAPPNLLTTMITAAIIKIITTTDNRVNQVPVLAKNATRPSDVFPTMLVVSVVATDVELSESRTIIVKTPTITSESKPITNA